MPDVEIYSQSGCPFCRAALALLQQKGVTYTEHDLSDLSDRELRDTLSKLCGRTTVPQIVIGGQHIGGYTDLAALESAGELDPLLKTS